MRRFFLLMVLAGVLMIGGFASSAFAQEEDTPPPEVGGTTVVEVGGSTAGELPFTGSTSTGTYVLVGLAIVALGGVLVVAGRRRDEVLSRS
jgi:LPXTG-motif cell wall-anchored protein